MKKKKQKRERKVWTSEEDKILLNQIRVYPHNLTKCFMIVGEQTGRTPSSVASHWYTSLSKKDDVLAFFTASPVHIAKNRKNGMGEEIKESIWNRFVSIIKEIFR